MSSWANIAEPRLKQGFLAEMNFIHAPKWLKANLPVNIDILLLPSNANLQWLPAFPHQLLQSPPFETKAQRRQWLAGSESGYSSLLSSYEKTNLVWSSLRHIQAWKFQHPVGEMNSMIKLLLVIVYAVENSQVSDETGIFAKKKLIRKNLLKAGSNFLKQSVHLQIGIN